MKPAFAKRIPNLDLVRAVAILMVVAYHVVQWLPVKPKWLVFLSTPGQYGVNLFFALSGFLVGSLYFREKQNFDSVDKTRFILRRVTRTVPAYLIALGISFAGSSIFEGEKFEWRYLLFLQNFMVTIPYFKVSWSLCVEEHFYAALPFFLAAIYAAHKRIDSLLLKLCIAGILLLPTCLRMIEFQPGQPFGVSTTASQYYMDSLGFGVLAAWVALNGKSWIRDANRSVLLFLFLSIAVLIGTEFATLTQIFGPGLLIMGICFAALTYFSSVSHQLAISSHATVKTIATASYSIYITHAVVLQALQMAMRKLPESLQSLWIVLGIIFAGAALAVGVVFYKLIEFPLLRVRDRYYPSRKALSQ
jgi:peptidoglycan/LPS O-acetylase OafA/YrhL